MAVVVVVVVVVVAVVVAVVAGVVVVVVVVVAVVVVVVVVIVVVAETSHRPEALSIPSAVQLGRKPRIPEPQGTHHKPPKGPKLW